MLAAVRDRARARRTAASRGRRAQVRRIPARLDPRRRARGSHRRGLRGWWFRGRARSDRPGCMLVASSGCRCRTSSRMRRRACRRSCSAAACPLPAYVVESVSGEPHEQHFAVACEVTALGLKTQGEGSSRRRAEQEAAQRLLDALAGETGAHERHDETPRAVTTGNTRCGFAALVGRPNVGQVDAAQCVARQEALDRESQAADNPQPDTRRADPSGPADRVRRSAGSARQPEPRNKPLHEPHGARLARRFGRQRVRDRGPAIHARGRARSRAARRPPAGR